MFRFQYKLTILIAFIILALLTGIFFVLQKRIEEDAIVNIKENLVETKSLVFRLMEDRQVRLWEIATGIAGAELVRVVLTDTTLDQITRDDIVEEEILPDYPQLSLLCIADINGTILAVNEESRTLTSLLLQQPVYRESLEGFSGSSFLLHDTFVVQLMALPVTIGEEEIIGILVVGVTWSQEDLERIKSLSKADVIIFQGRKIFLSSTIEHINGKPLPTTVFHDFLRNASERLGSSEPTITSLEKERFLYLTIFDEESDSPPYVIAKSLDRQLAFVKEIRRVMIEFGIIGILIGFLFAFIFALGVSHPIKRLQVAMVEVERGNLEHRVSIHSRDEFSQLGQSFNRMIEGLHEKERIRGVMNKVVSKEIADEILQSDLHLGGEEQIATILFSDIRGFTTFSEMLSPKELLDVLNAYFTRISSCIHEHHGNIDKYLGDAVMALFGVPVSRQHSAREAVFASLDMIDALKLFNQTLFSEFRKILHIGIGINTGKLVAGLMGASTRMEYTVLGDEVNLASRLEGLTKQYGVQIIISSSTYQALQASVSADTVLMKFRELDTVQVKGKTTGVTIYQVLTPSECIHEVDRYIERFQQARQLLEKCHFKESLDAFTELRHDWEHDVVTQVFHQRVDAYIHNPELFEQEYQNGIYICSSK